MLAGALADLGGDILPYSVLPIICLLSLLVPWRTVWGLAQARRDRRRTPVVIRYAALAGMAGPALFALVTATLTIAQYDFMLDIGWQPWQNPAGAWPSGLALGAYGWAQSLAFAVSGLLLAVFALGLERGIVEGSRVGPALLVLSGIAMSLLAFQTDPITRSGPRTMHGWIHDLAFVSFVAFLTLAFFFLWRRMAKDPLWQSHGRYTLVTGLLSVPLFLLPGPAYYLSLALILIWLEVLAIRLRHVSYRIR